MNILRNIKNKIIFLPLLFYPMVFVFAWFKFRKDFHISFPSKKITEKSTHFLFILTSKNNGQKYIVKYRNKFGDIYFRHHTGIKRLSKKEYFALLGKVSKNKYAKDIIPEIKIYKRRILWEYLENALILGSPELNLSKEKLEQIHEKVDTAVAELLKKGIIYGRVKKKHILVDKTSYKNRIILVDWDTARYRDPFFDYLEKGNVVFYGNSKFVPDIIKNNNEGRVDVFVKEDENIPNIVGVKVNQYKYLSEIQAQEADVCFLSNKATRALLYGFPTHILHVAISIKLGKSFFIMLIGLIRRRLFLKSIIIERIISLKNGQSVSRWLLVRNKSFRTSQRHLSLSKDVGVGNFLHFLKKENVRYVILRSFDKLPLLGRGGDLDILVDDKDKEKIKHFLEHNKGSIPVDLFSISGLAGNQLPYYPPRLARKIIESAVQGPANSYIPNKREYFLSLSYHVIYHKGTVSGLPSAIIKTPVGKEKNNKYINTLSALARELDIKTDITMESIEEYLYKNGWRPQLDTLFKISQRNEWVRKRFFGKEKSDGKEVGLGVFIIRHGALTRGIDGKILEELRKKDALKILYVEKFKKENIKYISEHLRGGNWIGREGNTQDMFPAMVILVLDMYVLNCAKAGVANLEFKRRMQNTKKAIRAQCDIKGTSLIHSTDNTNESWEYIEVCLPNEVENIKKAIEINYNSLRLSMVDRIKLYIENIPEAMKHYNKKLYSSIRMRIIEWLEGVK